MVSDVTGHCVDSLNCDEKRIIDEGVSPNPQLLVKTLLPQAPLCCTFVLVFACVETAGVVCVVGLVDVVGRRAEMEN